MKSVLVSATILFLLLAPAYGLSDFDFWEYQYEKLVSAKYGIGISLMYEKKWEGPMTLELQLNHNYPIRVSRVEFNGEDVTGKAVILKTYKQLKETFTISYDPSILAFDSKPLDPGYHSLLVEIGNEYDKKTIIAALKIDPELNIARAGSAKEVKKIFSKLQEQRARTQTLDCHFDLATVSRKGRVRVEQAVEGRLEITGEDLFNYTFAYIPKIKINGRSVKESKLGNIVPKNKKGSRLLLSPRNPAYYIPYDDLYSHYDWCIYKRIGSKVWMFGRLTRGDLWLPRYVELVIDEKRSLPLEVKTFIYINEFAAATARIDYDKNGLPIKQTVERRLPRHAGAGPGGEQEISTLILTNLEPNKRAPKKRWLLF